MALISANDVELAFGGPVLLDGVNLQIDAGERVCLVGRNGEGKSTLLKILAGEILPDAGEVSRRQNLRIATLPQEVPRGLSGTAYDVVAGGLGVRGKLLREFHHVSNRLAAEASDLLLERLAELQHALDAGEGWEIHRQVEMVMTRLKLDPEIEASTLSGGLKRRLLLARALVSDPDLLVLDEPTNHLDLDSIAWLEDFLLETGRTLLFVTHDRMFLRKLATRIVELDRGLIHNWACDYDRYIERKAAALEAEAGHWAQFDKKLAREESWIRQGIKARRTRNEGRVRALRKMREQRRARRELTGNVRFQVQEAERSGRLVIEAEGVGYSYEGVPVVRDFSTIVIRGDKVGIIGPNGCGKTTLLQLLLGRLAPDAGRVRLGTRLEVAYFDQLREQLDEDRTVQENVAEGNDRITVNGRTRHVIGYLEDFLFRPERARSPVKVLSGGERNRLLLARLFARPSNVLVMDEPTNDLDAETLELLEELLMDYTGTVLLVSHDRSFLNNVVTSTLVFEGGERIGEYVGGYDDWLRQTRAAPAGASVTAKEASSPKRHKPRPEAVGPRKLTFNERRELEGLPGRIEALENEQKSLYAALSDPSLYQGDAEGVTNMTSRLETVEGELAETLERWETLASIDG